ncbi:NUDIX hydrolase [Nitratireductor soli]|uniref:NUDIX hydrolase n=1 Tax=Nitratireductor soli TaxID=1670619 RepID=UPI00065E1DC7|nr:membrane protein [Nitratireductor soli]
MNASDDIDMRHEVEVELIALVAAMAESQPVALTVRQGTALPSGPFELGHRSLQEGLRGWVRQQTGHPLGYIEQLYTFADRDRIANGQTRRTISISYLGLTHDDGAERKQDWRGWYSYFPWEDHRSEPPPVIGHTILPQLQAWAENGGAVARETRWHRTALAFGFDGRPWNEELVLQRYELLYEAGLVAEALRGHGGGHEAPLPGWEMLADHRRILATGIARLRTKIKYRPVVFELMPPEFTLLQLQRTVEALAGRLVHKQNFRRLIEQQELVEETGQTTAETGGRPAKLFRFRPAVLVERTAAGTKLPIARA